MIHNHLQFQFRKVPPNTSEYDQVRSAERNKPGTCSSCWYDLGVCPSTFLKESKFSFKCFPKSLTKLLWYYDTVFQQYSISGDINILMCAFQYYFTNLNLLVYWLWKNLWNVTVGLCIVLSLFFLSLPPRFCRWSLKP